MNRIDSNSNSLLPRRILANQQQQLQRVGEKLATGLRINRGADDPAGLITSENLRAALKGIEAELKSLQRTSHVASTADASLGTMADQIAEAEALAVANANSAGMSDAEKQANQMQFDSLMQNINRMASSSQFNGQKLFDGSVTLDADGQQVEIDAITTGSLGDEDAGVMLADLTSGGSHNIVDGDLEQVQSTLSAARNQINTLRGELGALEKYGVESRMENLKVTMENVAAAESQIRDTDYAKSASELARYQVLEAGALKAVSMTHANASNVIELLG